MIKGVDYTGITIVYFCHDGKGNVVLGQRNSTARDEQGRWDIGGGGLEHGESIEQTLQREIFEEYGTTVLDHEFLGFREVHREHEGAKTHWIAFDFKVLVDAQLINSQFRSIHNFLFFSRSIEKFCFQNDRGKT